MEEQDRSCEYLSGVSPVWCPGCGYYGILSALVEAFADLNLPTKELALISGIGCSSRLPYFVKAYGFHSIHGRGLPIAQGVKAANPDLTVVAVGGDGDGLAIGGGHLPHIARNNVDITYLLFNNAIYGMTKGQFSPTTALFPITKTSPFGLAGESEGRGLRNGKKGGRGGELPLGHSVNGIVEQQIGDVHVVARNVRQMAPSDSQAVSVAPDRDYGQIRIGCFDPLGDGQTAAVNAVKAVGLDEIGQPAGAADPGDERQLFGR